MVGTKTTWPPFEVGLNTGGILTGGEFIMTGISSASGRGGKSGSSDIGPNNFLLEFFYSFCKLLLCLFVFSFKVIFDSFYLSFEVNQSVYLTLEEIWVDNKIRINIVILNYNLVTESEYFIYRIR